MSLISFVLPIYNESGNIPRLWSELQQLENKLKPHFSCEFIFVDDKSSDNSLELLRDLHHAHKNIKLLSFSRNYGHQIAVTAAQDKAEGDAVIIMDSDLQDPPMVCIDLIKKWEEGYEVVFAKRRKYKTNFSKEISAFVFYRLMSKIANVDIPVDTGDFRLLSKKVNLEMRKYREHSRFLRGISSLVGFKQTSVEFDRQDRFAGKPGYTFLKSLRLAFDGITGFSLFPLRIISIIGFILAFGSFVLGLTYVIYSIFYHQAATGWASLISSIVFLGGMQLLMLGIIGEYVGRIYIEVLNRPLYTIDEEVGF